MPATRRLGIIGSFEMEANTLLDGPEQHIIETPHGCVDVTVGTLAGVSVVQMTRSGSKHPLPPHAVQYRANIAALVALGVTDVVATTMVGSLRPSIPVGTLLLLDQFLDFNKTRRHTYYDPDDFAFVDFSDPYCPRLRDELLRTASVCEQPLVPNGCYVCVEGPRFETRAEVRMYGLLGGDVIGMTNVPECTMAREAGLCYAVLAGVVNLGAGLTGETLSAESFRELRRRHMRIQEHLISTLVARSFATDAPQPRCSCGEAARTQRQGQKYHDDAHSTSNTAG